VGTYSKSSKHYDSIFRYVNYENECDALEKIFSKYSCKKPSTILDVGCGTGSHTVILSKRGYSVTGIDMSDRMIELAKSKALDKRVEADFFSQDMRSMKLGNRKFDCSICMFGVFNYLLTPEDLARFFSGLKRHIVSGGLFIFEFNNVSAIRPFNLGRFWKKIQDGRNNLYVLSESGFDVETSIHEVDVTYISTEEKGTETFSERHQFKAYSIPEIRRHLSDNGFELLSTCDWEIGNKTELRETDYGTFRVLAIARFL
jgi:ubiquinone/menaquinone biosynthesis C-methylase UbiE